MSDAEATVWLCLDCGCGLWDFRPRCPACAIEDWRRRHGRPTADTIEIGGAVMRGNTGTSVRQDLPPLAGCPICKRLPRDGHDDFCTEERRANAEAERLAFTSPAPVVVKRWAGPLMDPPEMRNRETAMPQVERRRAVAHIDERKETEMPPANTVEDALAAKGIASPAKAHTCTKCGRSDVPFSLTRQGKPRSQCKPCVAAYAKEWAARRKAESENKASSGPAMPSPAKTTSPELSPATELLELVKSHLQRLRPYLIDGVLLARAIGMTVEDLVGEAADDVLKRSREGAA